MEPGCNGSRRVLQKIVGVTRVVVRRQPSDATVDGSNAAIPAQSRQRTSACSRTVWVAFSCLSGGPATSERRTTRALVNHVARERATTPHQVLERLLAEAATTHGYKPHFNENIDVYFSTPHGSVLDFTGPESTNQDRLAERWQHRAGRR